MRIGLCTNMIASEPGSTGIEYIERMAALGFDYIELPLAEMTAMDEDAFSSIVKRVTDSGIRCETCNNFFPPAIRLTGPETDPAAISAYVDRALDRAARLGVEIVVFGSGGAKQVPDGFPLNDGYRQIVSLIKDIISPAAAKHNITIAIEPLRSQECNLINTYEEGCKLAKDADMDNVKVLVDYYHLLQESEPLSHLNEGAAYLRHVHFAENQGRSYPKDEGESYRAFAQTLLDIGYSGRVSLEAYTTDFDRQAPQALAILRNLFKQA